MSKDRIITKWGPIIKNLGVVNTKLIEYISIYCEKYQFENPDINDLPEKLKNILSKLSKSRLEVKTYYNPLYGKFEYELLSNGLVVDEFNKFESDLTQENMIELFGVDFLRELDVQKFREERLNNIING
jgi:hypothetical protein